MTLLLCVEFEHLYYLQCHVKIASAFVCHSFIFRLGSNSQRYVGLHRAMFAARSLFQEYEIHPRWRQLSDRRSTDQATAQTNRLDSNDEICAYSHTSIIFLTFLTFHRRLPVCVVASLAETFPSFPVSGSSSLTFQAFRSLLTVSFHCNLCLPLGRFPSIFISTTARMFKFHLFF